jgi:hypothetical protein
MMAMHMPSREVMAVDEAGNRFWDMDSCIEGWSSVAYRFSSHVSFMLIES